VKIKDIVNASKIAFAVLKENLTLSNMDKMTDDQFSAFTGSYNSDSKYIFNQIGTSFQTAAYDNCPPLQSIINKKAQAITKGKLICVDKDENVITSKAFDEAMKVLRKPNAYQTKNQFERTLETFINVYGAAYVYKVKPVGYDKITGLIIIPNNCITISYNKPSNILSNQAKLIRYYSITIFGMTFMLNGDDTDLIYEIQDTSCNLTQGFEMQPKSRIDALRKPIQNIIGSLESRNHLIKRRGADVLLSPQAGKGELGMGNEFTNEQKLEIQRDYERYGLLNNQFSTMISKYPTTASKIGMDVRQLGLFDGENADHRAISQAFGIPIPLIGLPDTTKFNTYLEAKTEFYEDTIIPDSEVISQAYDVLFDSEKYGYKFYYDYSHLECMQKSTKDSAMGFKTMVDGCVLAVTNGMMKVEDAVTVINDFIK